VRGVSRQSKIGRANVHASIILVTGYPKVGKPARAVAPSLCHTLADCARQPAQPDRRFSTVENRPRRPPAPTCVQAS
jgi:hypothetical protein